MQALLDEAVAAYERVHEAFVSATEEEWAQLDLTVTQLRVLFVLSRTGPISVGRLADRLGTRLPSASVLVDRLVRAGLVSRGADPDDRRRVLVLPTDRALELVRRLRRGSVELRGWLQALSPEALDSLIAGLRALGDVAGAGIRFSYLDRESAATDPPSRGR